MMRQPVIVGLGEICWDIYPEGKYLGGAPANVAIHAAQLGADGIIASAVGQDALGNECLQFVDDLNLQTNYIQQVDQYSTGTVKVTLDKEGIPSFDCSDDTAFDHVSWTEALDSLTRMSDAVVIGTLGQRYDDSRRTIQKFLVRMQGKTIFDVNFRDWNERVQSAVEFTLIHADVLKMSEEECRQLMKFMDKENTSVIAFMDWLLSEFQLSLCAMSMGKRGCFMTNGSHHVLSPGFAVDVVDTTGCGDAFVAGLTIKFLENAELEDIAEYANLIGAFTALKKGAVPIYTLGEFEEFRATHKERNPQTF